MLGSTKLRKQKSELSDCGVKGERDRRKWNKKSLRLQGGSKKVLARQEQQKVRKPVPHCRTPTPFRDESASVSPMGSIISSVTRLGIR